MKKYEKRFKIMLVYIFAFLVIVNSASYAETSINTQSNISENNIHQIQYSDDYLKWLYSTDEEKREYGNVIPEKEFIQVHFDKEIEINEGLNANTETSEEKQDEDIETFEGNNEQNAKIGKEDKSIKVESEATSLPSYYKIPNLVVENQKDSGWCWAFASLKTLETYLQRNYGYYNLAEYHLAYMRYKSFGGWRDIDKNGYSSYGGAAYNEGGSYGDFMNYVGCTNSSDYFVKGPIGGTEEENKIYLFQDNVINEFNNKTPLFKVTKIINFASISKKYESNGTISYYNGDTKLTDEQVTEFRNEVKKHIKNKGGLYTCTKMDDKRICDVYFNNNNIKTNHCVTIVGWDDNYSKYNFNEGNRPIHDGAYIVLNSWGEQSGDNGYIYISYDDAFVEKELRGILEAEKYSQVPQTVISYSNNEPTNGDVKVTITSNQRLRMQNSNGWEIKPELSYDTKYAKIITTKTSLEKTYTSNAEEEVTYTDDSGKIVLKNTIKVNNIDKKAPELISITGNATNWTKEDITLTVNATDADSGIAKENGYSFDGGKTWQTENTKTYSKNESGIIIKVKDEAGNIATAETINITKIDNKAPVIKSVTGNATNWTKEDITLTVNATDVDSGIAKENGYSFDGGKTWQTEKTKTYSKNESGIIVKVKDKLGNIGNFYPISVTKIDKDGPKIKIAIETTKEINRVKIKLSADEAIKNVDELNLSNNSKVENYILSEDERELQIIYVNNTENDIRIIDKFIVKDFLGNESTVNLEMENVVLPTKVFKMTYKTTYQEIKKGENTYISNISPNATLESLFKNIYSNGNIAIYKKDEKIIDKSVKIATGMKLKAEYDNKIYEYAVAVNGDTNGDGEVNMRDILAINKHRLGKTLLKNEYELAGDVNKDNKIDIRDILKLNKFRLNKISSL